MALPKKKTEIESNYLKKKYMFIGEAKIGKTTLSSMLGSETNKMLFFPTEAGHAFAEIYKWQIDEVVEETNYETGEVTDVTIQRDPTKWEHFLQAVYEMSKQNEFKCMVIDTVDNLFDWCQSYVRKKEGISHESDQAFGKAYQTLQKEFAAPINFLAQKGVGIIFITHAKHNDVEEKGRKFTRIEASLPNTAKKVVYPLVDYIFYFHYGENGERLIRTKATANIVAGDRSGVLSELIPMDAQILIDELNKPIKPIKPITKTKGVNNESTIMV